MSFWDHLLIVLGFKQHPATGAATSLTAAQAALDEAASHIDDVVAHATNHQVLTDAVVSAASQTIATAVAKNTEVQKIATDAQTLSNIVAAAKSL